MNKNGHKIKVIIETVEEMQHCGLSPEWIKEEVSCMFDQEFTLKEWDHIISQAQIRKDLTRPIQQKVQQHQN